MGIREQEGEAKKHRPEWCAAANTYRCMRCGRSGKHVKMQGKSEGPKWLREDSKPELARSGTSHLGGHDMVRRVDRNGEALIWCRKCSGYARHRLGPKLTNQCTTEKLDTKEFGIMIKRILSLQEGRIPAKNARGWKI